MKQVFKNRKTLYFVLSIVLVCVFSLTIVYAALNTVLKITGNAEVVASNWDIYLDNVQLVNGSATTSIPTITNKTMASFTTTLKNPGDYYMFTVDVVNNGSIDAMIDSIEKTPTLTEAQAKYLNYIVEYQNGESISTKQLVEANSFVRLKVKVEFRKDLVASDLPGISETLNLAFTVKYTQADESGTSSVPNDGKLVKVVNGDYDTVGSEICIGEECFYVISSTDEDVTMFAKYNLYVGNECTSASSLSCTPYGEEATGIQDSTMLGWVTSNTTPRTGVVGFAKEGYWDSYVSSYPSYVFDNNSDIYQYIEFYKNYLLNFGVNIDEARLISKEELVELGCDVSISSCKNSPYSFVYSSSYWTGTAETSNGVWFSMGMGSKSFSYNKKSLYENRGMFGVRPVIVIPKSEFN